MFKYHPEIEGLKVNQDGSKVLYCGESLHIKQHQRTQRKSSMRYVYFKGRIHSISKLVCECWHGMADNPRWCATRKEKDKGFHYTNLYWAPRGTDPNKRQAKRGNSKIKKADIPVIAKRLKKGDTLSAIAKDYNTSDMSISRLKKQLQRG